MKAKRIIRKAVGLTAFITFIIAVGFVGTADKLVNTDSYGCNESITWAVIFGLISAFLALAFKVIVDCEDNK